MLFTNLITATIALAIGVSAIPTPSAHTRHIQLRIFGKPGCSELNQGEIGVYEDGINKCHAFIDTNIRSVSFERQIVEGCTLSVYNDITCHLNEHVVEPETCLSGDKLYGSYFVHCPEASE
ncbi:hypothetical protein N7457_001829 [Penicillium paradoxum]|uniref:uncharacterized protein n=1 Tax=Penicillium paradoxum TaxID=176176 RepID=UPI002546CA3B|nr:uncharacterized protein N7457_001829 [Penicillium paradoxum]KAJ5795230.1 hypothetical protein N7457_001829 [Penicillium paradoxum]